MPGAPTKEQLLIQQLEEEIEAVEKMLADDTKHRKWLREWKKEATEKHAEAVRRSELPETRDKKVNKGKD